MCPLHFVIKWWYIGLCLYLIMGYIKSAPKGLKTA